MNVRAVIASRVWPLAAALVVLVTRLASASAPILTIPNPVAAATGFGFSVAVSDDYVVVGNPYRIGATSRGEAYVFNATTGALLHTLPSPFDTGSDHLFGISVAIAGQRVVISAMYVGGEVGAGGLFVFDAASGAFERALVAEGGAVGYQGDVGCCVVAHGDAIAALGLFVQDPFLTGAAFTFDAATGSPTHTFSGSADFTDGFASDVDVHDGRLLLAALGEAHLHDLSDGALLHTLPKPDGQNGDAVRVALGDTRAFLRTAQGTTVAAYDVASGASLGVLESPFGAEPLNEALVATGDDVVLATTSLPGRLALIDGASGVVRDETLLPNPAAAGVGSSIAATGSRVAVGIIPDQYDPSDPLRYGAVLVFATPICGNGVLEGLEECDDGNTLEGDCCAAACTLDAAGTACGPATDLCTTGQCDGTGSCNLGPWDGCFPADKLRMKLLDASEDQLDHLTFRLRAVDGGTSLGDPLAATDYALCLFDHSSGSLALGLTAEAGRLCSGDSCWKARTRPNRQMFEYRDRLREAGGLARFHIDAGPHGVRVKVAAHGEDLSTPAIPVSGYADVQVRTSDGVCWTATAMQ